MDRDERARLAKCLRDDEAFQLFTTEFREHCMAEFANSTANQSDKREEAHAQLRALTKLQGILDSAIAEQTLADHRQGKNVRRKDDR